MEGVTSAIHWDGDEPVYGGTTASGQPAKPFPASKGFNSAQVTMAGNRKDTLQIQSTNYPIFVSQPSLFLTY